MRPILRFSLALATVATFAVEARAGGPFSRRRAECPPSPVPTAAIVRPENQLRTSGMLGTFQSTPYVVVRGNGVNGGGYSPLGGFGRENSLDVYGPLSAFRETAAPVPVVVRGYNGVPTLEEGTGFSNPNLPGLSNVVYPTRASNYSALRYQTTPPRWDKGLMWVDQN